MSLKYHSDLSVLQIIKMAIWPKCNKKLCPKHPAACASKRRSQKGMKPLGVKTACGCMPNIVFTCSIQCLRKTSTSEADSFLGFLLFVLWFAFSIIHRSGKVNGPGTGHSWAGTGNWFCVAKGVSGKRRCSLIRGPAKAVLITVLI